MSTNGPRAPKLDDETSLLYRFEPEGDATVVIESREVSAHRSLGARVFASLLRGGTNGHDDEMRQGMVDTLDRLKAVAEGRAAS